MATTIHGSFDRYKSILEITDRQTALIATRRSSVVNALKAKLTLHSTSPSLLIGSNDRSTMTRYLKEADVDVMVILNYGAHKEWDTNAGATKALDRFKDILDAAFPATYKRRDQNCITMQYPEFRMDVVPAFQMGTTSSTLYEIPDSVRERWIQTDPFTFAGKITSINSSMGGTFVPLIKMVKGWNRNVDWPIRSFHLECMMEQRFRYYSQAYTYDSMLVGFFEALPGMLRSACYDPVTSDRVDEYLDNHAFKTKREIAIEKAEKAAKAARVAYDDQTLYASTIEISIREWKALLGEFFPAYG